ncbi:Flp family type IVb pilin [Roseiarcus sp.]|uniref:Flp family type IVb pilin n=1 Tax=Roseiarcus sp. TaxID=1969460 RepID=UPI003F98A6DF
MPDDTRAARDPNPSRLRGANSGESDMSLFRRFAQDASGATAIEYALMASLIAVAIISAVQLVGTQASTVFAEVGNALH